MKQLLQNIRDGKAEVADIPIPAVKAGMILVRNQASVVSAGTERMIVSFAEKNLLGKATSRPDLVRQVLDKAKREGIIPTLEAAFNRLDQPMALGYSCAGIVEQVGEGVQNLTPGMRVACAGGGYATHSEYVVVPKNLAVPFSEKVTFEEAAFATLGAISLQGFRLANSQVGERVAVIGLGLLGCLMVDIAKAAGCSVLGIDLNPARVELAVQLGINAVNTRNAVTQGASFTQNRGFDAVFICADTSSNEPVELAGILARDRGVVVAVGAVGLEIPRKNYYEKEISFLISRSYGPGRYDSNYEENGVDYPYGYVRWTEGRNLEAVVTLLEEGKLNVKPLVTHRFPIEEGVRAYEVITGKRDEPFMGVVLTYQAASFGESEQVEKRVFLQPVVQAQSTVNVGVLGAGLYAGAVFLPVIRKQGGVTLAGICSAKGLNARHAAQKYEFRFACTDEGQILDDSGINTVVILTRHNDHPRQIIRALENNKHVYCEKPIAIDGDSLMEIRKHVEDSEFNLMAGFNRRFAPLAVKLHEFLAGNCEPLYMRYRINAGFLPTTHWLHDPALGGGRIIGEGCHFIDFLTFLSGKTPVSVETFGLPDLGKYREDNVSMTITFDDGSLGVVDYLANGDKSVPKEAVEIFAGGKVAVLDDFRKLTLVKNGRIRTISSPGRQDKGHAAAWAAFIQSIKTGSPSPIPFSDIWNVTQSSFAALRSLREQRRIPIETYR